jgi:hypothetical protein
MVENSPQRIFRLDKGVEAPVKIKDLWTVFNPRYSELRWSDFVLRHVKVDTDGMQNTTI